MTKQVSQVKADTTIDGIRFVRKDIEGFNEFTAQQAESHKDPVSRLALAGAVAGFPLEVTMSAIGDTVLGEGLREFYGPHDGRGMGARDFAWSALALDMLDPGNANAGVVEGG